MRRLAAWSLRLVKLHHLWPRERLKEVNLTSVPIGSVIHEPHGPKLLAEESGAVQHRFFKSISWFMQTVRGAFFSYYRRDAY